MTVLELAGKIVDGCIEHEQNCDCEGHKSGEIPRLTDEDKAALKRAFSTQQMFSITMSIVARICALDPRTALTFVQDISTVSLKAQSAMMDGLTADGEAVEEIPEPAGNA